MDGSAVRAATRIDIIIVGPREIFLDGTPMADVCNIFVVYRYPDRGPSPSACRIWEAEWNVQFLGLRSNLDRGVVQGD